MRKFLISAALAASVVTVAPAVAQPGYGQGYDQRGDRFDPRDDRFDQRGDRFDERDDYRGGWNRGGPSRQAVNQLVRDLNRVEFRIERSVERRIISRREAFGLRREANMIRNRLDWAARNGISGREFASLRVQVNRLEMRLRVERNDRDGRRY